jgi:hypothetical protein
LGIAVLVAVVAGTAASGAEKSGAKKKAKAPRTTTELSIGEISVQSVAQPTPQLAPAVTDSVKTALTNYVTVATVNALRRGAVAPAELPWVFDGAAVARMAGPDAGAVVDQGLPKAVGKLMVTTPPVPLTVLVDSDANPVAATAKLALVVSGRTAQGRFLLKRTGDLTLLPDGANGWRVTGWDLAVERSGKGLPLPVPSTVPAAGATPSSTATATR